MRDMPITFKVGFRESIIHLPIGMFHAHAAQAEINHGQTVERLAERGGLAAYEALAILHDHERRDVEPGYAVSCIMLAYRWWPASCGCGKSKTTSVILQTCPDCGDKFRKVP